MANATAYIGLGANLGNAVDTLRDALNELCDLRGIYDCECSTFFGSAPLDAPGPHYINAVARLSTTLAPLNLLTTLQQIELEHGRIRTVRNAPRTLDLDLLWYDGITVTTPTLTLPHPRMTQRAFVLRPLAQLLDSRPLKGQSLEALLALCADQQCEPISESWTRSRQRLIVQ